MGPGAVTRSLRRDLSSALLFTAVATAAPLRAQAPAEAPGAAVGAPVIPATPAGDALRAWLDAFNSGESTRIATYLRQFEPGTPLPVALMVRGQSGGFDLLTIERSEPRRIEFLLRARRGAAAAYGLLAVSERAPGRVSRRVQPLGPSVSAATRRIDAPTRARVVAGAAALLDTFYVVPDAARRMGDSLRARLARGAYDGYANGLSFAARLDEELRAITNDSHLHVQYSVRPLPPEPAADADPAARPAPTPEQAARERRELDEANCGFRKAERLDGNVGYVKFDFFADSAPCGPTAAAAMSFVAGTRALILDLRENEGGRASMVALVTSYLFDRRTHLDDVWTRATGRTRALWTLDRVPGRRFGGAKPVVVLTSARTHSAAEAFAYDLRALGRATIVGETTAGGAHLVRDRRLGDHFVLSVPYARAINPVTGTNWEGVGVVPDVQVPAGEALARARHLLLQPPHEKSRP